MTIPPFRYELRSVTAKELERINRAEGRKGNARYRSANDEIGAMGETENLMETRGIDWVTHPDERVPAALAESPLLYPMSGSTDRNTVAWERQLFQTLVERASHDAAAEGVPWSPLLDCLADRQGGLGKKSPQRQLFARWLADQRDPAAIRAALEFPANATAEIVLRHAGVVDADMVDAALDGHVELRQALFRNPAFRAPDVQRYVGERLLKAVQSGQDDIAVTIAAAFSAGRARLSNDVVRQIVTIALSGPVVTSAPRRGGSPKRAPIVALRVLSEYPYTHEADLTALAVPSTAKPLSSRTQPSHPAASAGEIWVAVVQEMNDAEESGARLAIDAGQSLADARAAVPGALTDPAFRALMKTYPDCVNFPLLLRDATRTEHRELLLHLMQTNWPVEEVLPAAQPAFLTDLTVQDMDGALGGLLRIDDEATLKTLARMPGLFENDLWCLILLQSAVRTSPIARRILKVMPVDIAERVFKGVAADMDQHHIALDLLTRPELLARLSPADLLPLLQSGDAETRQQALVLGARMTGAMATAVPTPGAGEGDSGPQPVDHEGVSRQSDARVTSPGPHGSAGRTLGTSAPETLRWNTHPSTAMTIPPFRYKLRSVTERELAHINAQEGRKGSALYHAAVDEIRWLEASDNVLAKRVDDWVTHPDERVAAALAGSRLLHINPRTPNGKTTTRKRALFQALVDRATRDAAAEGVPWSPLLEQLAAREAGLGDAQPVLVAFARWLADQRDPAAIRAALAFRSPHTLEFVVRHAGVLDTATVDKALDGHFDTRAGLFRNPASRTPEILAHVRRKLLAGARSRNKHHALEIARVFAEVNHSHVGAHTPVPALADPEGAAFEDAAAGDEWMALIQALETAAGQDDRSRRIVQQLIDARASMPGALRAPAARRFFETHPLFTDRHYLLREATRAEHRALFLDLVEQGRALDDLMCGAQAQYLADLSVQEMEQALDNTLSIEQETTVALLTHIPGLFATEQACDLLLGSQALDTPTGQQILRNMPGAIAESLFHKMLDAPDRHGETHRLALELLSLPALQARLTPEHVAPLLESRNGAIRQAALVAASRLTGVAAVPARTRRRAR